MRRARAVDVSVGPARSSRSGGALLVGCAAASCGSRSVQPPGGKPMPADAYLRGHPLAEAVERDASRARRGALAFETLRRDLRGRRLRRARLPRRRRARSGSPGASAPRPSALAYGAVQRRGTSDAAIERLAGRSTRTARPTGPRRPAPRPLRAALRRRHARPRRGRPGGRAGQGRRRRPRGPASSTRSCAAPPASGPSCARRCSSDDSTPEAAAVAHSAPEWLARMWWEELGPDGAARCSPPQRARPVAMRVDTLRGDREAALAQLRAAGVDAAAPRASGRWLRRRWSSITGRTGEAVPALVAARRADAAEPRLGRGRRGADPRRRAVLSLLRRPGDQDQADRGAGSGIGAS